MNKENLILTSNRAVWFVMLCILFSVTCPGLLLAEDDPLLEPIAIPLTPADETDQQEAPVFVNVDWACEDKAVKPKSSSGSSGDGLVGALEDVKEKMDGDSKGETSTVKATLQIPIAAVARVGEDQNTWEVILRMQMPVFDIPDEMPEDTKKSLNSEIKKMKEIIPDWSRQLTPEQVRQLLSTGELSIEMPPEFNKPGKYWEREDKVLLPIRMNEDEEVELKFLVKSESIFIPAPAEGIKYDEVFVVEVQFAIPQEEQFVVIELNWEGSGQPVELRCTGSDDLVYRSDQLRVIYESGIQLVVE